MRALQLLAASAAVGSSFGAPIPPPTGRDLAMRDAAKAAAFGLFTPSHFGGDASSTFGDDYDNDGMGFGFGFGDEGQINAAQMGDPRFAQNQLARGDTRQIDVNRDAFRNLVGQRNRLAHTDSVEAHQVAMWREAARREQRRAMVTEQRKAMLDPNADSDIDVEHYRFPISQTIPALGTPSIFVGFFGQPDTRIRPERAFMNAPSPGFVLITDIKVANVSALIGGGGQTDAWFYSATAVGSRVSLPTLDPANKLSIQGSYSGMVPPGFAIAPFPFVVEVSGPATMAGQGRQ